MPCKGCCVEVTPDNDLDSIFFVCVLGKIKKKKKKVSLIFASAYEFLRSRMVYVTILFVFP